MKKLKRKLHWKIWSIAYRIQRRLYPDCHEVGKIFENGIEITDGVESKPALRRRTPPTQWDYKP